MSSLPTSLLWTSQMMEGISTTKAKLIKLHQDVSHLWAATLEKQTCTNKTSWTNLCVSLVPVKTNVIIKTARTLNCQCKRGKFIISVRKILTLSFQNPLFVPYPREQIYDSYLPDVSIHSKDIEMFSKEHFCNNTFWEGFISLRNWSFSTHWGVNIC